MFHRRGSASQPNKGWGLTLIVWASALHSRSTPSPSTNRRAAPRVRAGGSERVHPSSMCDASFICGGGAVRDLQRESPTFPIAYAPSRANAGKRGPSVCGGKGGSHGLGAQGNAGEGWRVCDTGPDGAICVNASAALASQRLQGDVGTPSHLSHASLTPRHPLPSRRMADGALRRRGLEG